MGNVNGGSLAGVFFPFDGSSIRTCDEVPGIALTQVDSNVFNAMLESITGWFCLGMSLPKVY